VIQLRTAPRRFAIAAAIGLLAGCSQQSENLLLVSLDTTRRDHLPIYGYSRDTAPVLARLAREGVIFDRAFAQDSNTIPSHASERFLAFVEKARGVDLLFVNDGSRDRTLELLNDLHARCPERISLVDQRKHGGKAEAVRAGMNVAFQHGARYAGYFDADLSTPLEESLRMVDILDRDERCDIVFGARVQLLGREIQRSALRHYSGRVFATLASTCLGLPVYDTQCGAKLFRVTPDTQAIFSQPFTTGWVFDVEIVARLIAARHGSELPQASEAIYEMPLNQWVDVAGSKVRAIDFVRAVGEMWKIHRYLRRTVRH
jgi:hypothetical protein